MGWLGFLGSGRHVKDVELSAGGRFAGRGLRGIMRDMIAINDVLCDCLVGDQNPGGRFATLT